METCFATFMKEVNGLQVMIDQPNIVVVVINQLMVIVICLILNLWRLFVVCWIFSPFQLKLASPSNFIHHV